MYIPVWNIPQICYNFQERKQMNMTGIGWFIDWLVFSANLYRGEQVLETLTWIVKVVYTNFPCRSPLCEYLKTLNWRRNFFRNYWKEMFDIRYIRLTKKPKKTVFWLTLSTLIRVPCNTPEWVLNLRFSVGTCWSFKMLDSYNGRKCLLDS